MFLVFIQNVMPDMLYMSFYYYRLLNKKQYNYNLCMI